MIHAVYSDLPTFKNLNFHSGLNILLADKEQSSTDRQTTNRAGKSSLIRIIHFLMGEDVDKQSIFRSDALKSYTFGIEVDLDNQVVSVERAGKLFGRTCVCKGDTTKWSIQPVSKRGYSPSYSTQDWNSILGEIFFSLPPDYEHQRDKFSPTFRSLFSYFVRIESEGGFRHPENNSTFQQTADQQTAIAFLLGLDWKIYQSWESVRQREKNLDELKKAASVGAFGSLISTSAQLRTELILAEQASERIHSSLNSFEVLPEYHQLEQEASKLTRDLNESSNQNTLDEELISQIRASFQNETMPGSDVLLRMYQELGVSFPDLVNRRFEEVQKFHNSVIANRKEYLSSELLSAQSRLAKRRNDMKQLDQRRAQIMKLLESHKALDQFLALQREASRQDAVTESTRQRYESALQLEGASTELSIERASLMQQLRRELIEQNELITEAITTFEKISRALYHQAGSLTFTPTPNGLKTDVVIQGKKSRAIENMQIFCFDLMLMTLCWKHKIGPGFLIHDSHIFDGVDRRQVAHALALGSSTANEIGWQYIVTMNAHDLPVDVLKEYPTEFPENFSFEKFILPVRLTDASENGGLFGFRF